MKNIIFSLFIVVLSFFIGYHIRKNQVERVIETKVDTLYIRDTIIHIEPCYIRHRVVDTLLVKVSDTLLEYIHDTLYISINKEERVYTDDSTYYAVVSGYRPSLDSIFVYRESSIISRDRIERVRGRKFGIGIGLQAGGGYNPIERKPCMYIGLGINIGYNLIR